MKIFIHSFPRLSPPKTYCDHASLLVDSFVGYARCGFSKTTSPIFMKFGTDVQYLRH